MNLLGVLVPKEFKIKHQDVSNLELETTKKPFAFKTYEDWVKEGGGSVCFHDFTIVNVQKEQKFQTQGLKQVQRFITNVLTSESLKSTKIQHATLFLYNLKKTVDSFNDEINKLKEEENMYEMQIIKV